MWAADSSQGFNGSAAYVRWVRDDNDAAEATARVTSASEVVRVARFVEGIPCSVHGLVTDDGVAVFRPVELLTLRADTIPHLRFAGAGTFWDPPPSDRDAMRDAARRVGAVLRDRVDFRGAFTVDGILSDDGWVANECNPRMGAGLGYVREAVPDLAFDLLHHAVIAGDGAAIAAAELEARVVTNADARRWGATWLRPSASWPETFAQPIAGDETGYTAVDSEDAADAVLTMGPGPTGGFLRCAFKHERTPIGSSLGPRAVAAFAFADEHFDAGVGSLVPASTVRV